MCVSMSGLVILTSNEWIIAGYEETIEEEPTSIESHAITFSTTALNKGTNHTFDLNEELHSAILKL